VERGRNEFRRRVLAESLSERFGVALLAGDSHTAEGVAREALEVLGEARLYDLVVGPAMHRIGQLWAAGEIGVAHEHLATQITTRVLVLAHELAGLPAQRAQHTAIFATVEGEQHVLALDMAAKLLESSGYKVLMLGADLPTSALRAIVSDYSRRCSPSPPRFRRPASGCRRRSTRSSKRRRTSASYWAEQASRRSSLRARGWSWSRASPGWSRLPTG